MATQFGERIRELRTKQNLLLRQLASQLDVDQLYNMVQGEPMADEALKSVTKQIKKTK